MVQNSLAHEAQFVGLMVKKQTNRNRILNNGLHVIIEIDANSPIGKTDAAGVKDLTLEAAVTTIQDLKILLQLLMQKKKLKATVTG
jgi:malate synthase